MWAAGVWASGTSDSQMSEALALAKLFDPAEVDRALGHAAVHGRFAEADLASILDHHTGARSGEPATTRARWSREHQGHKDHTTDARCPCGAGPAHRC